MESITYGFLYIASGPNWWWCFIAIKEDLVGAHTIIRELISGEAFPFDKGHGITRLCKVRNSIALEPVAVTTVEEDSVGILTTSNSVHQGV